MMSYFSLVAVFLLLLTGGTDAGRLYPASHEKSKNETSFLIQADTNTSGPFTYWAVHQMQAGDSAGYYGFSVTMDVYNFKLSNEQYSSACVHISNVGDGAVTSLNAIHIGWEVNPALYGGDSCTHLAAIWTTDGFQKTSCINLNCPVGFQPESGAAISLGDVIEPVSQPNGAKQSITIKVLKDSASGDWLVHYGLNAAEPALIGRFPKSLFTGGMADRATNILIGAEVIGRSTDLTPMGSGYLPTGDAKAAASFSNIQTIDQNGQASLITHNLDSYLTQNTYAITPVVNGQFFYGGPLQPTA